MRSDHQVGKLARDHQVAKLECDRQVVKLGVLSKTRTCSGGSSRGISAPTGASLLREDTRRWRWWRWRWWWVAVAVVVAAVVVLWRWGEVWGVGSGWPATTKSPSWSATAKSLNWVS